MRGHFQSTLGAADTPATTSADYLNVAQQLAPTVAAYLSPQDAREEAALIRAKIENLTRMKSAFPVAAVFYTNEINKLKARLAVVDVQARETQEGINATRDWRNIGQATAGIGMLVGVALIGLLVAGTIRLVR